MRGVPESACLVVGLSIGHGDGCADKVAGRPCTIMKRERAGSRTACQHRRHLRVDLEGVDIDMSTSRGQQLGFPGRRCTATGDHGTLAIETEEQR